MNYLLLQIVYVQPSYSLLFLAVIAMGLLYIGLWRYRKKVQARFGLTEIISKIAPLRNETFFWLRLLCLAQCFFFGALATMQPVFHRAQEKVAASATGTSEGEKAPLPEVYDEVVFIMDVSSSMAAQDASEHDARFNRAKEIVEATVEHLGGMSISLYAFAGTCENEVPATMDYLYFRILLEALHLNETHVAGTNFAALIDEMQEKYLKAKVQRKTRFILLTDGEDTTLIDFPAQEKRKAETALVERLASFKKVGIVWDVVGLGSGSSSVIPGIIQESKPVYSTMQADFITRLANGSGGHYYFDNSLSLTRIVDGLVANTARIEKSNQKNEMKGEAALPLSSYPLFAAFLFLALAIILPERIRATVFVLLLCCSSSVFAQDPLAHGMNYYFSNRPDLAAQEFEALLSDKFSPEEKQVILYNMATALLAEGYLNEADHAFDEIDTKLITSPKVLQSYYLNRALCALQIATRSIELGPQGLSLIDLYNEAQGFIKKAESSLPQLQSPNNEALAQEIQRVKLRFDSAQLEWAIEEKSQTFRLNWFAGELSVRVEELTSYQLSSEEIKLYEEAIIQDVQRKSTLFLRGIFEEKQGLVPTFIEEKKKEIATLQGWELIEALDALRFAILLYNAKNDEAQIKKALLLIIEAHAYAAIFKEQNAEQLMWQNVEKERADFLSKLIEEKSALGKKQNDSSIDVPLAFQKELLSKLSGYLLKFGPEEALKYYTVLCQPENLSFSSLASDQKEPEAVRLFQALIARIGAKSEAFKEGGNRHDLDRLGSTLKLLEAAEKSYPKKEALIEAWRTFDQEYCLRFLLELALKNKTQETSDLFIFLWNKLKTEFPGKYNEAKASVDRDLGVLVDAQKRKSADQERSVTACLYSIVYELFYVNGVYPTKLVAQAEFATAYEKKAIDDLEFFQKMRQDEKPDLFEKTMDVLHMTTLNSLMSLENAKLDEKQKAELNQLQRLFCALYPSSITVEGEILAHKKALQFFEKLAQETQKNEAKQSEANPEPQKQKSGGGEQKLGAGQSNLEITPDEAWSTLLQMEKEDRTSENARAQIQTQVGKPW